MAERQFTPGEIVDITIRGARIEEQDGEALGLELTPGHPHSTPIDLPLIESVDVARSASSDWPPQPRDVWRDSDPLTLVHRDEVTQ